LIQKNQKIKLNCSRSAKNFSSTNLQKECPPRRTNDKRFLELVIDEKFFFSLTSPIERGNL
jgi:hypothetical protein